MKVKYNRTQKRIANKKSVCQNVMLTYILTHTLFIDLSKI